MALSINQLMAKSLGAINASSCSTFSQPRTFSAEGKNTVFLHSRAPLGNLICVLELCAATLPVCAPAHPFLCVQTPSMICCSPLPYSSYLSLLHLQFFSVFTLFFMFWRGPRRRGPRAARTSPRRPSVVCGPVGSVRCTMQLASHRDFAVFSEVQCLDTLPSVLGVGEGVGASALPVRFEGHHGGRGGRGGGRGGRQGPRRVRGRGGKTIKQILISCNKFID